MKTDHLALAKEALAIAESGSAKREAYKRAASHAAIYKKETNCSGEFLARNLATTSGTISKLLKWHASGYKAETPFLMDEKATTRAAISHAKKVLREHPEDVKEEIAEALTTMPPKEAIEVVESLTARDDVIEQFADDPKTAERVLHAPSAKVWTRKERKEGTSKSPRVKTQANALSVLAVRNEIRLHLLKAAELAAEHNLVAFFFEHVEDISATLEMSVHGKNPKQAVADLEAWLADQQEAAS